MSFLIPWNRGAKLPAGSVREGSRQIQLLPAIIFRFTDRKVGRIIDIVQETKKKEGLNIQQNVYKMVRALGINDKRRSK